MAIHSASDIRIMSGMAAAQESRPAGGPGRFLKPGPSHLSDIVDPYLMMRFY
jgi:hypothetical protein